MQGLISRSCFAVSISSLEFPRHLENIRAHQVANLPRSRAVCHQDSQVANSTVNHLVNLRGNQVEKLLRDRVVSPL
jgi:hypothetical protein